MKEQICNRETQLKLPVVENADAILTDIHLQLMPVAVYLTARPACIHKETKIWLREKGFPDAEVITRSPKAENLNSCEWKADLLSRLFPEVCGLIDNDSQQVESFPSDYQGTIFLFGHSESPRKDIKVIPCPNWKSVKDNIEKLIKSDQSQDASPEVR